MSKKKYYIKMYIYRDVFRRRNSFLHKAIETNKVDKANRADNIKSAHIEVRR